MNSLLRYLKRNKISFAAMGQKVGVSGAQIHRIAHGERGASLDVAAALQKETKGAVKAIDLAAQAKKSA